MKKIAIICFLLSGISILSACGTIHGFGQDVAAAGQDIQKAAR